MQFMVLVPEELNRLAMVRNLGKHGAKVVTLYMTTA